MAIKKFYGTDEDSNRFYGEIDTELKIGKINSRELRRVEIKENEISFIWDWRICTIKPKKDRWLGSFKNGSRDIVFWIMFEKELVVVPE